MIGFKLRTATAGGWRQRPCLLPATKTLIVEPQMGPAAEAPQERSQAPFALDRPPMDASLDQGNPDDLSCNPEAAA